MPIGFYYEMSRFLIMKTGLFIILVLVSGCFAGLIHGGINLAIVEPYLDQAIGIENQTLFATGEEEDTPELINKSSFLCVEDEIVPPKI